MTSGVFLLYGYKSIAKETPLKQCFNPTDQRYLREDLAQQIFLASSQPVPKKEERQQRFNKLQQRGRCARTRFSVFLLFRREARRGSVVTLCYSLRSVEHCHQSHVCAAREACAAHKACAIGHSAPLIATDSAKHVYSTCQQTCGFHLLATMCVSLASKNTCFTCQQNMCVLLASKHVCFTCKRTCVFHLLATICASFASKHTCFTCQQNMRVSLASNHLCFICQQTYVFHMLAKHVCFTCQQTYVLHLLANTRVSLASKLYFTCKQTCVFYLLANRHIPLANKHVCFTCQQTCVFYLSRNSAGVVGFVSVK